MPNSKIILKVVEPVVERRAYAFDRHAELVIGRALDCDIQFDGLAGHTDVSRHHCLVDIDPPAVRIRDLGSFNGTFVNGEKIGQRARELEPDEVDTGQSEVRSLSDGDEVVIGHTVLRISIHPAATIIFPPPFV